MKKINKLITITSLGLMLSTSINAIAEESVRSTMPEKAIEAHKRMLSKRYEKMDQAQLSRRKAMLEKRIDSVKSEKQKEQLQLELDTIKELIQE